MVPEAELKTRRQQWLPPETKASRGYAKLYIQHVTQAHEGCDFDFLQGTPGETPEPDIY
ncbi:MAG TPA: dihydroxy-acid dehydratase [Deltaproteobacteria bacterium]|nr:dihydroxy-acid dehydratase [Deltaproteobacteria bacterium]